MASVSSYAPGRVELLGNHTDYNEGFVLSAAIDRGVTIEAESRDDGKIKLESATMNREVELDADNLRPMPDDDWANYPAGVVKGFVDRGLPVSGFSAKISSDLPLGAGLSSSAALEVATAMLLVKLSGQSMDMLEIAKLCRKAENEFVGVNCGLLDQVSSALGKAGHAIFLDCRHESVETVPFPPDVTLLITHSGVKHALTGGEYNERRAQCFDAAEKLGAMALRDVSLEQLENGRDLLPERVHLRALHVVGENARVLDGVGFLRAGNVREFGELMFLSHESSRVNFENSTPELDALVAIAREVEGVYGSRLTGGGFGGATVSIVTRDKSEHIASEFSRLYGMRTGLVCETYLCEIADGAH